MAVESAEHQRSGSRLIFIAVRLTMGKLVPSGHHKRLQHCEGPNVCGQAQKNDSV